MKTQEQIRQFLKETIRAHPIYDYATLSMLLGKTGSYIYCFITENKPQKLDDHDRHVLAEVLGVSEIELGGDENYIQPTKCDKDLMHFCMCLSIADYANKNGLPISELQASDIANEASAYYERYAAFDPGGR